MLFSLPPVPPSQVSAAIVSIADRERPPVILDGLAIPRVPLSTLAWLLSDDDDTEAAIDPETAQAPVYLGTRELSTWIIDRDLLERLDQIADTTGLDVNELVADLLRKAVA